MSVYSYLVLDFVVEHHTCSGAEAAAACGAHVAAGLADENLVVFVLGPDSHNGTNGPVVADD
jgi:hypothetical protein